VRGEWLATPANASPRSRGIDPNRERPTTMHVTIEFCTV